MCGGKIFGRKTRKTMKAMCAITEATRVKASALASRFSSGSTSRFASPPVRMSVPTISRRSAEISAGRSNFSMSASASGSTYAGTTTRVSSTSIGNWRSLMGPKSGKGVAARPRSTKVRSTRTPSGKCSGIVVAPVSGAAVSESTVGTTVRSSMYVVLRVPFLRRSSGVTGLTSLGTRMRGIMVWLRLASANRRHPV